MTSTTGTTSGTPGATTVSTAVGSRTAEELEELGDWAESFDALLATAGRDRAAAVLQALSVKPDPSLVLLAYAAAALLALIPLTPGGLGFVEAGLTGLLVVAGVDAGEADAARATHPVGEGLDRAEARRCGGEFAQDAAQRPGVVGLHILLVGAGVADVGGGEGDDLAGVGRVCHDLLVAGHGGVEADLANRMALRAEAAAP